MLVFSLGTAYSVSNKTAAICYTKKSNDIGIFVLCLFLALFIGLRPEHAVFGDTWVYKIEYNTPDSDTFDSDWLYAVLEKLSYRVFSWEVFCVFIALVYVFFMFFACKRLNTSSTTLLMIFCLGGNFFWGVAVNGLRKGMACSVLVLAITYLIGNKPKWPVFILLSIIATGLHKSVLLPFACALFVFFYRKPKVMFYFWFFSIIISLVAGSTMETLLSGLLADDRMDSYLSMETKSEYADMFSSTGFRWDFLLYSFMPIFLGWYVIFKRKIIDWNYYILLGTYIYANSFWVMVIRATNSNRFAYLSWFIYPIVLAYPLLKHPVFKENHNFKTSLVLVAHFSFTFVMYLLGGY